MTEVRATYELIRATESREDAPVPGSSFSYDETAAHYAYNLPENALRFESLAQLQQAVTESGSHYWDREAVKFFRGRTHSATVGTDLAGGRFWVESRKYENAFSGDSAPREYMVAWVSEYVNTDGERSLSIEKLGNLDNLPAARGWARRLAEAVEATKSETVES